MTRAKDIARLGEIGSMILDLRLADLRRATEARQKTQAQIAGLALSPEAKGISPVAACLANQRYQTWADARRGELNILLARQTAAVLLREDAARLAFGRVQALNGIAGKLR